MLTLLGLGFLIGMRHAFEADHAAAVASLATKSTSLAQTVRQGIVWGLGHTLTLLLFGSMVFLLEAVVPERLAALLEFGVGLMLLGLGLDVLRKLLIERVHWHVHQHPDRHPHVHAHSHRHEADHGASSHDHGHAAQGFPYRALFVGFMHGMAGTAALILLTIHQTISPWTGILYIAVFGLGSMAGMAVLSAVIALPLRYSARSLTWLHNGLQGCIGLATIVLGMTVLYSTASTLLS